MVQVKTVGLVAYHAILPKYEYKDPINVTFLDLWINGGSSICSQLNKEVLRNIKEVFTDLQTQVKLKLLLSFFHIPRRLIDEVS